MVDICCEADALRIIVTIREDFAHRGGHQICAADRTHSDEPGSCTGDRDSPRSCVVPSSDCVIRARDHGQSMWDVEFVFRPNPEQLWITACQALN